jgi:hypothetical protein
MTERGGKENTLRFLMAGLSNRETVSNGKILSLTSTAQPSFKRRVLNPIDVFREVSQLQRPTLTKLTGAWPR